MKAMLVSCSILIAATAASAQPPLPKPDPIGPIVRDAPYSGEGITTITQTFGDGTKINRRVTARLYRDSAGRIRREQTIIGLESLNPSKESEALVTIVDPVEGMIYAVNPVTHTAYRIPYDGRGLDRPDGASVPVPPPPPPPPPPGPEGAQPKPPPAPREEALGMRQIEGVMATGRRSTVTLATGAIGNDRPITIVDERWESPELKLLLRSRHIDPRTGTIDFGVTNLQRVEPPPDLFKVPADYTIIDGKRPPPPPPPPPDLP